MLRLMARVLIGVPQEHAFSWQETKARAAWPQSYRPRARFTSIPFEAQQNLYTLPHEYQAGQPFRRFRWCRQCKWPDSARFEKYPGKSQKYAGLASTP